ncbi:MAG: ice-binding family protein, partial [Opitutus sp.]
MKTPSHLRLSRLVALTTILGLAISASAQVLLSTSEFALLGGTAITVGGPGPNSIVNGNVGLSPAATTNITGFPPAVVSGNTLSGSAAAIIATGGATGQARLDLITARNALAAMPSNHNVSNVDLGTMAALFSGVYTFNGAATQTGALVLDAQGQNAVSWVFQIGTSLTTAVNSTVTFINLGSNGGNDLGLFWNAGTAINIGDNNTILGNYLAGTAISFTGSTATLGNGGARALSLAG